MNLEINKLAEVLVQLSESSRNI